MRCDKPLFISICFYQTKIVQMYVAFFFLTLIFFFLTILMYHSLFLKGEHSDILFLMMNLAPVDEFGSE